MCKKREERARRPLQKVCTYSSAAGKSPPDNHLRFVRRVRTAQSRIGSAFRRITRRESAYFGAVARSAPQPLKPAWNAGLAHRGDSISPGRALVVIAENRSQRLDDLAERDEVRHGIHERGQDAALREPPRRARRAASRRPPGRAVHAAPAGACTCSVSTAGSTTSMGIGRSSPPTNSLTPTTICSFCSIARCALQALSWISRWKNPDSMALSAPPIPSIFRMSAPALSTREAVSASIAHEPPSGSRRA